MKKLTISAFIIFALVILGCDNSTEDDSPSGYTVKFASYQGTDPSSQTVTEGVKISKPGDPTRNGSAFKGWSKNGGIDTWNFDTDVVTENTVLCARWEFTTIEGLKTFLNATVPQDQSARHTNQGIDPNVGKLPIPVTVKIQLTRQNWADLVNGIEGVHKKVSLDLSDCTVGDQDGTGTPGGLWTNGTFNPLDNNAGYLTPTASRVNNTIIGLILPKAATKLQQATTNLNLLKDIRGDEVTEIVTNGSFHGGFMAKVYFPKLTDIKDNLQEAQFLEVAYLPKIEKLQASALKWTWVANAPGLRDVDIRSATEIQTLAFAQSGNADLTITLGANPPKLGTSIFDGITGNKNVTVRVPHDSKSNYTEAWQQGLTGKGWSSESGVGNGPVKRNINVTIVEY